MDRQDFIVSLVRQAGARLKAHTGMHVSSKDGDPKDIVTQADLDLDGFIGSAIREAYPEDAIYSEEAPIEPGDAMWIVDPIDGTSNYSRRIPHYAISIGYMEQGVPSMGAVFNPITDELYSFRKGGGAFLNGERIRVSDRTALPEMSVLFRAGRRAGSAEWGGRSYASLLQTVWKVNSLGSASLDVCFVAAGRIEACIYGTFSALDSAPALGILAEAGGVAYGKDGAPVAYDIEPHAFIASNSEATASALRSMIFS